MSRELYNQTIGPLNKGVNQQADSFVLPGFSKVLENGNCDLVEGLKKRLGSVPCRRIDTLTQNAGGNTLVGTRNWDDAWYFVYNRSDTERFILIIGDDSRTITRTGNTTNNSPVITNLSNNTDLFVGATITGTGIPAGTTITSLDATNSRLTLSANATAAGTGTTFTIESRYVFTTALANVEPISGTLPTVVPTEQTFAGITTANLGYFRGSGRARDRLRATSFQDFVFVTNTQKATAYSDTAAQLERWNVDLISNNYVPTKAQIDIKLVDYSTLYRVDIVLDDDTKIGGHYLTPTLASGDANSSADIASKLVTSGTETITGNTNSASYEVSSVSAADMKKVHVGTYITGTGMPAGTFVATVNTSNGTFNICDQQGNFRNASATATGTTFTLHHGIDQCDLTNQLTFTVQDSQILIGLSNASRSFKSVVASDARGSTLMGGFSNQVVSTVELPENSWHGYTVLVAPTGSADQSSYYLKFNAENITTDGTYGRGHWEESGGWNARGRIDAATMPHAFVYYRNDDGLVRFTVDRFDGTDYTDGGVTIDIASWVNRLAGDEDEMPGPSFVTTTDNDLKYISDIVFFKNRLGFISGENVILSEAGDYYNFWVQSAVQVVDTDPIDLTAVSNDVAVLTFALQQQDELVLFSNENQFRLYSGDNVTFSPETASVGRISSISMEANVRPQQVGPQVIFPVREGDFTGLHTFITTDRTVGINLGQTAVITETVPKYIPKNVDSLAVSRTDQYLIALSSDDNDSLYVYQFFWEAAGGSLTNKQNAWSKWTFPNKQIHWCDFVEGTLYTDTEYDNNGDTEYYLEGINASRPPQDEKELFLLDRQLASSITTDIGLGTRTFNNLTNRTTINLPYSTLNPSQFVIIRENSADASEAKKRWIVAQSVPAGVTSFILDSLGDYSDTGKPNLEWVFGENFTFKYQPPKLMPYAKTATDNTFIGSRTGRLQLRYLDLYYNDARYFTVEVTPDFRDKQTYEFDRRDPLNANIVLSQASSFDEAKFRAYIQSKNDQVTIEVVNNSIDQAKFVALEWTGLYYDVARKFQ